MRRAVLFSVLLVISLAAAAAAEATVRKVSFTRTVSPNGEATLSVIVAPRTRCTITVVYDTVVSEAKGLNSKVGGRITWRWKVGSTTHAGRWPVTVNCGKSGKIRLLLHVT